MGSSATRLRDSFQAMQYRHLPRQQNLASTVTIKARGYHFRMGLAGIEDQLLDLGTFKLNMAPRLDLGKMFG